MHYTTSCNTQSSAPEDGQNNCPKHVELTGIINKPLLLHVVVCLCYLYQLCTVKKISDNEIYLLIKYIKSVLWRAAKRLSYIEDARCLKVNRLIKHSKMFGMGRNVKETMVLRISRQPSRVQIMTERNNLIYSPQYSCLANIVNELQVLRFFTFKL